MTRKKTATVGQVVDLYRAKERARERLDAAFERDDAEGTPESAHDVEQAETEYQQARAAWLAALPQ